MYLMVAQLVNNVNYDYLSKEKGKKKK